MNEMTLPSRHTELEPWWSEAEHANSRSLRLFTILNLYVAFLTSRISYTTFCSNATMHTILPAIAYHYSVFQSGNRVRFGI